jgi:glyoxylase-like metal-dependent hydrolase (beta-lactamase superfamily II)
MKILKFEFNPIEVNTYAVYDETLQCVIIDAGCSNGYENDILQQAIAKHNLKPVKLICTHGHLDHIMGNNFVCNTYNINTFIHKNDLENVVNATAHSLYFNVDIIQPPTPSNFLDDGDEITFGNSSLKVFFTPGHTRGGICLYSEANKLLFSGDTLFKNSIGRTDLPGGNYDVLINSLQKLMKLPNDTKVYCGHGETTTIGSEKETNPFITEMI